jgi:predicted enzyme related to lactoylglutathione lyase
MVFDANGVVMRIAKVQELSPAKHTVLGWAVADLDAEIRSLRERGVTFERFPGLPQDETGVWVSPTGAQIAWFKDPDGNLLSLTESES